MRRAAQRWLTALALLGAWAPAAPTPLHAAQDTREQQHHPLNSAEGRILGFYSAALASSALGVATGTTGRASAKLHMELRGELAYIPYLNRQQRTAGFDKPESSNLSPVLPRPSVLITLPGLAALDLAWIPPIRVNDADANIFALGLSRSAEVGPSTLAIRLSYLSGKVTGAITCFSELGEGTIEDQVYYAAVCHSRESADHFSPRHVAAELTWLLPAVNGSIRPFISVGGRDESAEFDIGVVRSDGTRDPDHPVLQMDATRFFGSIGAQLESESGFRYMTELYYVPGSLVTGRVMIARRLF